VPSKGEETVFDIFDRAVSDLKARRTDAAKVVDEADKRLPNSTAEKETWNRPGGAWSPDKFSQSKPIASFEDMARFCGMLS
jgi:hypothetical protein